MEKDEVVSRRKAQCEELEDAGWGAIMNRQFDRLQMQTHASRQSGSIDSRASGVASKRHLE